jgi:hypothetical protein
VTGLNTRVKKLPLSPANQKAAGIFPAAFLVDFILQFSWLPFLPLSLRRLPFSLQLLF